MASAGAIAVVWGVLDVVENGRRCSGNLGFHVASGSGRLSGASPENAADRRCDAPQIGAALPANTSDG